MKMSRVFWFLSVIFLIASSLAFGQSKETGAIIGTIILEDGSPAVGATVTLTSDTVVGATKVTLSNQDGQYRFVGLNPGSYSVSASLEGYATAKQKGIQIHIGKTFTVDLIVKQGSITEKVEVVGKSPIVDVKESSTASIEMTTEYLQNVPNAQFTTDAVNMAPGITNNVAYGAASNTGINYQIDGVNVQDPAAGASWVFLDYNVVEEMSISGIGAPAEYGGFSGVVFNTVTKSGGNKYKGYAEFLYQDKTWTKSNSPDPLFEPSKKMFYSGHVDVGGPIIKDKLSFFFAGLYYREKEKLSGTDYDLDYKQPKGFLKLTWQPTAKTRLNAFMEIDTYNGSGRSGGAMVAKEATINQKSPEIVTNLSLNHLLSDLTFLETKLAYFDGYYALEPVNGRNVSGVGDLLTDERSVNAQYFYRGDRKRLQANVSVSHHADDFIKGNHDFKFGADLMFSKQRDQYGYNGGAFIWQVYGENYLKVENGGYDISAKLNSYSAYLQDSWNVFDRLTINPGVRMDISRGRVMDIPGTQFKTNASFAPRIGITFDVFGDHTTAVKGHWGRYYEGSYISAFSALSKNKFPYAEYWWDYNTNTWELDPGSVIPGGTSQYIIDDKLKQAYMDQLTFGLERQLMKDLSVGFTFIHRKNYNHIAPINVGAEYEKIEYTIPQTGETITVWSQTNNLSDNVYLITNPKAGDLPWIESTPWRKYTGLEFLINKRFSNKWQLMASYVYSKATGNVDNSQSVGAGYTSSYSNPNKQIYAVGHLSNDPTHMLKIQGSVILPFDINVNADFSMISGQTYALIYRLPSGVDINRSTIFVEPRGSKRLPMSHVLNLRLEKTFNIKNMKLGLLLDIFNVFNEGIETSVQTLITASNVNEMLSISSPLAYRAGIRFWF